MKKKTLDRITWWAIFLFQLYGLFLFTLVSPGGIIGMAISISLGLGLGAMWSLAACKKALYWEWKYSAERSSLICKLYRKLNMQHWLLGIYRDTDGRKEN